MPYYYVPESKTKSVKKRRKKVQRVVKDEAGEVKRDITELQQKKQKVIAEAKTALSELKGIKKFAVKTKFISRIGAIDKAIKQREQFLANRFRTRDLKQRMDIAKSQEELREIQKKNAIKSEDVFGTQDLFKI